MRFVISLFSALVVAGSAVAPATGVDRAKEEAENRKFMHDYAKCVVKSDGKVASEAIVSNASIVTIFERFPTLVYINCLCRVGGDITKRFGGDIRYALADALVNVDFATNNELDFTNRLPLAHLLAPSQSELDAALANTKSKRKHLELKERFDNQVRMAWLSRYGECIVRRDPVKARLWLLTPPDVPEETSRINELRPTFAACLGEGTLKFNRATMRGTVAVNYYRLAMATPQPVAGKSQ